MSTYAVGFATVLRSHDLPEHVNNAVGLAKTAKAYGSGLEMTNGEAFKPSRAALPRIIKAGIVPVPWWSLAAEFQLEPRFADAPYRAQRTWNTSPSWRWPVEPTSPESPRAALRPGPVEHGRRRARHRTRRALIAIADYVEAHPEATI